MKKIFSIMLCMATLFTLVSCDSDSYRSMTLSGAWHGNFGAYYAYQYRNGQVEYFDSYETDIEFIPSYYFASHGYGYEVDWYRYGPYEYQSMRFEWKVVDRNIYLHFPHNEDWDAVIERYSLNSYEFTGYFNGGKERFLLRKLADFDWDNYYGYEYGYGPRPDFYSPNLSLDSLQGPMAIPEEGGRVIKHGYKLRNAQ